MLAVLAFVSAVVSVILLIVGAHAHLAAIFLALAVGLIALHLVYPWTPWARHP
jgi:hypothetical protein